MISSGIIGAILATPEPRTILVTSTDDSGPGTLRQSLLDARDGDTIAFNETVFPITCGTLTLGNESKSVAININGFLSAEKADINGDVLFTKTGAVLSCSSQFNFHGDAITAAEGVRSYLALPGGTTPPTVGSGVVLCTYGAAIQGTPKFTATAVTWTATNTSKTILIEKKNGDAWQTLSNNAAGGTYSGTFNQSDVIRLFDGENFVTATYQQPQPHGDPTFHAGDDEPGDDGDW